MPLVCSFMGLPAPCYAEASRIVNNVVYAFSTVVLIADGKRLAGVTLKQFADYVAMVGLAQIRPDARLGDVPTILKLFNGTPETAPSSMTDWDGAFLKSLYGTEQRYTQQRTQVAKTMKRQLEH
jgi:hypothetical protein